MKKTERKSDSTNNQISSTKSTPLKSKPDVYDVFRDVRGRIKYYDDILESKTEEREA